MSVYKPVLQQMEKQFNTYYKEINKKEPYRSKDDKALFSIERMAEERDKCNGTNFQHIQYRIEMRDLVAKISGELQHFYMPDSNLFEWMESTPVKESNMEYFYKKIDDMELSNSCYAIYTKNKSAVISFYNPKSVKWFKCDSFNKEDIYLMSVLFDDMHYTALLNMLNFKKLDSLDENSSDIKAFRLAMNFLFYLDAFPECILDGVPNEVKKENNSKIVNISNKVISNSGERLVSPHFRSGHFRHLNSEYYVNKKGSVVFIPSTMVKGKAKTIVK